MFTYSAGWAGISKEGITRHYFHRPSRAYSFGSRKRRKIQSGAGAAALGADGIAPVRRRKDYRWHKTGKTRPVLGLDKRQVAYLSCLLCFATRSLQSGPWHLLVQDKGMLRDS